MPLIKNFFFIFILLFFFSSLTKNFFEYQKNMSFYQGFKNEYQDEKKKNETLKTQLLKNNDSYEMEKTIRNQLNLTKDNEVEVIIPDPTPSPVVVTPTPEPPALQWAHTFIKNWNYDSICITSDDRLT